MAPKTFLILSVAAMGLSACSEGFEGTTSYKGPDSFIAVAGDRGRDSNNNQTDNAGIAITPDGCQAWYIDDGLEARASNRLDPVSGLPVCSNAAPPGTMIGPYRSGSEGIADRVPARPATIVRERVEVRSTRGQGQHVHPRHQRHH